MDGQINGLLADVSDRKHKLKEMSTEIYYCQLKVKGEEENEKVIKQGNTILQKENEFDESIDKAHSEKN